MNKRNNLVLLMALAVVPLALQLSACGEKFDTCENTLTCGDGDGDPTGGAGGGDGAATTRAAQGAVLAARSTPVPQPAVAKSLSATKSRRNASRASKTEIAKATRPTATPGQTHVWSAWRHHNAPTRQHQSARMTNVASAPKTTTAITLKARSCVMRGAVWNAPGGRICLRGEFVQSGDEHLHDD